MIQIDGKSVNVFKELASSNISGLSTKVIDNEECIVDEFGNLLIFLNQKTRPVLGVETRHVICNNSLVGLNPQTMNLALEHTKVYSPYYREFNILSLGPDGKFSNFYMRDHKTDVLDATKKIN